ncbi:Mss4-like protein [Phellopilus nigrolimitatus]|nr:Mss4-like protein [Phellopilus nigrolimitatus]
MSAKFNIRDLPCFRKWPEGAEVKTRTGGCHCRRFTYELEHPVLDACQPVTCNCTICAQKAELFVYGPETAFRFTSGSFDKLTGYKWYKNIVTRWFCPTCGVSLLYNGNDIVGVNARAYDGIEIDKLRPMFSIYVNSSSSSIAT